MCAAMQDWWNRVPPAMTASSAEGDRAVHVTCAIEEMPHLMRKICLLWEHGGLETFVDGILMDARDGKRQGLPWQAADELLFLVQLSLVKRALIASEATGLPFQQLVKEARAAAEAAKAGQRGNPWADPDSNRDNVRRARPDSPRPVEARAGQRKVSWWRRLFG